MLNKENVKRQWKQNGNINNFKYDMIFFNSRAFNYIEVI